MPVFDVLLIRALSLASRTHPYAPHAALAMPALPIVLRPFAAAFWAAHLFAALGPVWMTHVLPQDASLLVPILISVAGGLASFWAFGYLLILAYEDRDAPNRKAVSSLPDVLCTVVVE